MAMRLLVLLLVVELNSALARPTTEKEHIHYNCDCLTQTSCKYGEILIGDRCYNVDNWDSYLCITCQTTRQCPPGEIFIGGECRSTTRYHDSLIQIKYIKKLVTMQLMLKFTNHDVFFHFAVRGVSLNFVFVCSLFCY